MVDQWFFGWHFSLHSTLHTWDIHISAFRQNRTEIFEAKHMCFADAFCGCFVAKSPLSPLPNMHPNMRSEYSNRNRIVSSLQQIVDQFKWSFFFLITWIPEFMGNVAGTPYISYIYIYIMVWKKKTSFPVDVPINQPNDWIAVRTHLGTWTLKKRSAHFLPGSLGLLVPPFGKNIAHSYDWIRSSRHIPILVHSHMTWWCLNICVKNMYIYIYT